MTVDQNQSQEPCQGPPCRRRKKKCVLCCVLVLMLLNLFLAFSVASKVCPLYHLFTTGELVNEDTGEVSLFVPGGSSTLCNDLCVDICVTGAVGCDIRSCLDSCHLTLGDAPATEMIIVFEGENYYDSDSEPLIIVDRQPSSTVSLLRFYYIFDEYFDLGDSDSDSAYDYSELDQFYVAYLENYADTNYIYNEDLYSSYLAEDMVPADSDNLMILSATQMKITALYNELLAMQTQLESATDTDSVMYKLQEAQYVASKDELAQMIDGYDAMAAGFGVDATVADWLDVSEIYGEETL